MSVSIDRVYQTVLTIVNKEGLGYITPQEFNLYANQAQMEIFEKYFYDEYREATKPNLPAAYYRDNLTEKIAIFNREDYLTEVDDGGSIWKFEAPAISNPKKSGGASFTIVAGANNVYTLGSEMNSISTNNIHVFEDAEGTNEFTGEYEVFQRNGTRMIYSTANLTDKFALEVEPSLTKYEAYKLISLFYQGVNITEVDRTTISHMLRSPLTHPTTSQPVFHRVNESAGPLSDVRVYPYSVDSVSAYYIRKPKDIAWAVNDGDKIDFELHSSEFPELVIKILAYSGVTINRADIAQFAQNEEVKIANTQQ